MALTEIQLPAKADFYRMIQGAATEMDNVMTRWRNIAEFIGRMGVADLDAMGVALGQARTDLTEFRTAIEEVLAVWDGTTTTPTNVPSSVIDKIRRMT